MNGIILAPAFGGGKSGRDIPQHETRMHQHANKVGKKDVVSTFAFISRINKEEMCLCRAWHMAVTQQIFKGSIDELVAMDRTT